MRQLGRSHVPPLMANSHLGLFCWEIYDSVFPAGTRWDEEKLQLLSPCCLRHRWLQFFFSFLKVAMNQPVKGLMCFIWPELSFLLGGPFTLQRKRKQNAQHDTRIELSHI